MTYCNRSHRSYREWSRLASWRLCCCIVSLAGITFFNHNTQWTVSRWY